MKIKTTIHINSDISYPTNRLLQRMLSPLCGLDQRIGFMLRSRNHMAPRFMISGAELAGVHVLRNQQKPREGSYHIGGSGIFMEEAVIRTLGETIERYAQLLSEVNNLQTIIFGSYNEIITQDRHPISPDKLSFFSEEKYHSPDFPFHPFSPKMPMSWVKANSLINGSTLWIPAQLVLVGYTIKALKGEKWILTAVTTGTAAHTKPELALRNALLELIQIDSAMGHWYSSATASNIIPDSRTETIQRFIERNFSNPTVMPKFYWLPNPDLPGMTVACVIKDEKGESLVMGVGLGIDLNLVNAMYKAFLEALGVTYLAKISTLYQITSERAGSGTRINPDRIYNLDQNVIFYANPKNTSFIDTKFVNDTAIRASDLPQDFTGNIQDEICFLLDGFRSTNKELIYLDLTSEDIKQLGFTVIRAWSPDTISLSLPSTPPLMHPRFRAYGGATHENPHPYP